MIFFEKFTGGGIVTDTSPKIYSNNSQSLDVIDRLVEKVAENADYDTGEKIRNFHNTIKTVCNPIESIAETIEEISNSKPSFINEEPKIGDHIYVNRLLYSHHGIYIGDGQVIHYTGTPDNIENAMIQQDSIETFLNGGKLMIRNHEFPKYKGIEVVNRAMSRLIEQDYNLLNNNCQHFAEWCINGGY